MKTFKFLIWKVKIYTLDYSLKDDYSHIPVLHFYCHMNHKAFLDISYLLVFCVLKIA